MDNNITDQDETNKKALENILEILIETYSLPKFSDFIKETTLNSQERNEKILELQKKLLKINEMLEDNTNILSASSILNTKIYSKQVEKFKSILISKITDIYPDIPIFLIINDLNNKLNNKHQKMFEELNFDMTQRLQDIQNEKAVKDFLKHLFFSKFDLDGNGLVSLHELEDIFTSLNLPTSMAHQLMLKVDTGKDGKICISDFEQYTEKQIVKYYKIFHNLDSDKDNKLDFRQAKHSLYEVFPDLQLSDDIFSNVFETMDLDKTGFISFDEWCHFLFLFPQINLDHLVNEWKLYSITMMDPQQPSNAFFEKDIIVKKGTISTSYWDILKVFICGGIAGGLSRTVTAPLERLKLMYQTIYVETKPPTMLKGLYSIQH